MRLLLLTFCFLLGSNLDAQETKTSMGFVLSPNFSSVRYVNNEGVWQEYLSAIEAAKSGAVGLSGGVFFQYKLTDKFFITWGLGIQNYRYQLRYSQPSENQELVTGTATKYSQHYIQLNVSAKYRIYRTLYARAGIGVDALAEDKARWYKTSANGKDTYAGIGDSGNYNEVMLPVTVGVGYELKLTDRLNLMSELFATSSLTNALQKTNNTQLTQKPVQLGFNLGVIRSF